MFLLVSSTDHLSGLTGATASVNLSKAGGTFAAAAGTVTEVANGWYKVALTSADTGTIGDLAYHITATGADATDFADQVTVNILGDTLPVNVVDWNGATVGSLPTNFSSLAIDTSGNVSITDNIKKNTAVNNFMFMMTDSTTHAPKTGLTVTAQRSLDGAAFAACANSVVEISNGFYQINLATTDTNANKVMLRFSATGADDLGIELITQP